MKSCAGEEASEPRIELQRSDICYKELEQEGTHKQVCFLASLQVLGGEDLFLDQCFGRRESFASLGSRVLTNGLQGAKVLLP